MALMSFVDVVQVVSAESVVVFQTVEAAGLQGSLQHPPSHRLFLCTIPNGTHPGYICVLGINR